MWPTFGSLFGEPISAYFVMLMIGFSVATLIAARAAKRAGLDHDVIIDLSLLSLIAGVAGGRLLHVIADGYFMDYVHLCTNPDAVIWKTVETAGECRHLEGRWDTASSLCHAVTRDCFAWAEFWNGGLAYYGGLVVATAAGIAFLKREKFPVGKGVDLVGAVLPVGIFFGRLGCFLGGCCFGSETRGALGVSFPAGSPASDSQFQHGLLDSKELASLPVHPTQLYESLGCLAIAAWLLLYLLPRKRFDGQVLLAFLGSYAVLRFGIEYLRADDRGALLGLSTSQLIGVLIVAAVAVVWPKLAARSRAIIAA
ncbi:MAG TPA: prolipoprotein diacylglyceryl transferase [Polyangiales bacterium]|jgi:phosphatidylglycerol:prolipoprotein diacylglycerol transferase|nr:prolipoprotein diacylglyceryl transferase [Polyangiales bacterium]